MARFALAFLLLPTVASALPPEYEAEFETPATVFLPGDRRPREGRLVVAQPAKARGGPWRLSWTRTVFFDEIVPDGRITRELPASVHGKVLGLLKDYSVVRLDDGGHDELAILEHVRLKISEGTWVCGHDSGAWLYELDESTGTFRLPAHRYRKPVVRPFHEVRPHRLPRPSCRRSLLPWNW